MTADELQAAIDRAEAKRRELDSTALAGGGDTARILAALPRAAEYYGQQIALGLERNPQATTKGRAIVRDLLGGKVDLVPGEDGSLWAEYGLHLAALLQGAGTCGRGDRI
jgi:hypothetical protein